MEACLNVKRSRFKTEQIIGILHKHASGVGVTDLVRRHGISKATLYHWKKQYGDLEVSDAKWLKAL